MTTHLYPSQTEPKTSQIPAVVGGLASSITAIGAGLAGIVLEQSRTLPTETQVAILAAVALIVVTGQIGFVVIAVQTIRMSAVRGAAEEVPTVTWSTGLPILALLPFSSDLFEVEAIRNRTNGKTEVLVKLPAGESSWVAADQVKSLTYVSGSAVEATDSSQKIDIK